MKKIHRVSKKIYLFYILLISVYLFLFNTSCGLESYIYVAAPLGTLNVPQYNSSFDDRVFQFSTRELKYNGIDNYESSFAGTDVYYKIYNNLSTLQSERSRLEYLASNEDSQGTSASTMINTYKFKQLKCSDYTRSPLIPAITTGEKQDVKIRLTDYYDLESYSSSIFINDKLLGSTGKPVRNDGKLTFNFGQTGSNNVIPGQTSADDDLGDFSIGTATEDGTWYVSMFAVGVAYDETLSPYYSEVLYLGCVSIVENSFEN